MVSGPSCGVLVGAPGYTVHKRGGFFLPKQHLLVTGKMNQSSPYSVPKCSRQRGE